MFCLKQVSIVFLIIQCCEIVCRPQNQFKNRIQKSLKLEIIPLPFKHFRFVLEKVHPFGKYELKHDIQKRQIIQTDISPIFNEIPATNVAVEDINKPPVPEALDKNEDNFAPQVIITSVIKPFENSESFSFVRPVESEVVKQSSSEVLINEEIIPKQEDIVPQPQVIEIIPKPVEVPQLTETPAGIQNVIITTPIESTVPPLNNAPVLHTDISKIPLGGIPTPSSTPSPVPISEVIITPPPPPPPSLVPIHEVIITPPPLPRPPVKEPPLVKEPPVIKEETPNFFVKGSRFVLYFGSMMLQMLSQLVNGRINLNQPLPAILPDLQ